MSVCTVRGSYNILYSKGEPCRSLYSKGRQRRNLYSKTVSCMSLHNRRGHVRISTIREAFFYIHTTIYHNQGTTEQAE